MAKKYAKYRNSKPEWKGLKFDSELELYCYQMLERFKIPFKYQVEYELQPKFRSWNDEGIRRIFMKIDFIVRMPDGKMIFFDTKGFPTEASKIKYKWLEYQQVSLKRDYELHWLKTKKDVKNFVLDLYDKLKRL